MERRFPVLTVFACLAAAVSVHELGHVLAGLWCGGSISELTLFSLQPHVRILGDVTPGQEMFEAAAGSGAVLLLWLLWRIARPGSGIAGEAFSFAAAVELLGWTLSALHFPRPETPVDVARFLHAARLAPGWVVAGCICLAVAGLFVTRCTRCPKGKVPSVPVF